VHLLAIGIHWTRTIKGKRFYTLVSAIKRFDSSFTLPVMAQGIFILFHGHGQEWTSWTEWTRWTFR
jgi:hypothetical protein